MRKVAFVALFIGGLLWVLDANRPIPSAFLFLAALLFYINDHRRKKRPPTV